MRLAVGAGPLALSQTRAAALACRRVAAGVGSRHAGETVAFACRCVQVYAGVASVRVTPMRSPDRVCRVSCPVAYTIAYSPCAPRPTDPVPRGQL